MGGVFIPEIGEFVDEKDLEMVNEILEELRQKKRRKKKEQLKAQIIEKLKTKKEWAEILERRGARL